MSTPVTVWDGEGSPPAGSAVLYWRGNAGSDASVPHYLETHAERLRANYIAFIHDLGEYKIAGHSIIDHLSLGDGFSFWWMGQLSEKSPFKSPALYDCLRLMALAEMLSAENPSRVQLDSSNPDLACALKQMCKNSRIEFHWRQLRDARRTVFRRIYESLPYWVRGLIGLRHTMRRWILCRQHRPVWFGDERAVFMCSYFFNLDWKSFAEGYFHSHQWEQLPDHMHGQGWCTNWIHHFLHSPGGPDARTALEWMDRHNADSARQGNHAMLERYLGWRVLYKALRHWLFLNRVAARLGNVSQAFYPAGSAAWLWPFLRVDWAASLTGPVAMSNCLWVELFDAALKDIPHQGVGLYLWENQGWEVAMLRAWRRHGHGSITGVPHATVVFWHLNNFDDSRTLVSRNACPKPLPDRLAVNGPMARKAFLDAGYPAGRLVVVEALRFQYLNDYACRRAASPGFSAPAVVPRTKSVLVLGDFTVKQTFKMMNLVATALRNIQGKIKISLKPHPACPFRQEDFAEFPFELTNRPLPEILGKFDLAFSSNTSSAGLDAFLAGLSVAVFLDDEDFNHSPLRGTEGVRFVSTAGELAEVLITAKRAENFPVVEDFFCLDSRLPRWEKLLLESQAASAGINQDESGCLEKHERIFNV